MIKSKDGKDAAKDARSGAGPLTSLLVQSFAGCVLEEKSQSEKNQNIGVNVAEAENIAKINTVRYGLPESLDKLQDGV